MGIKDAIKSIKAFFAIKKILKKEGMKIESIQKIWVMIGSIIVGLNASWIPDLVVDAVSPEATNLIFTAAGAIVAVYQWFKGRTGEGQPQQLKRQKGSNVDYLLNPFAKA